jgi:hypothetical protein
MAEIGGGDGGVTTYPQKSPNPTCLRHKRAIRPLSAHLFDKSKIGVYESCVAQVRLR